MKDLLAPCSCTSALLIRGGRIVCASCGAAVRIEDDVAPDVYTSARLPPDLPDDARGRELFARACKAGRVRGASKRGRVWSCERSAWDERAPAPKPNVPAKSRPAKTRAKTRDDAKPSAVSEELLDQLGVRRVG